MKKTKNIERKKKEKRKNEKNKRKKDRKKESTKEIEKGMMNLRQTNNLSRLQDSIGSQISSAEIWDILRYICPGDGKMRTLAP